MHPAPPGSPRSPLLPRWRGRDGRGAAWDDRLRGLQDRFDPLREH